MKTFDELFRELSRKAEQHDESSRTVVELNQGVHEIGKKIVEEAGEVWMAAEYETQENLATEISQLLYHAQVMMIARGLNLEDIYREL